MNKALRTTLALVILISAAANAPGLLLALGNSEKAEPAAKAGSTIAPVDHYAYDYDYDTAQSDPGEWLDTLFREGNEASVASWHHNWTDFESTPAADTLRPAHWEPEGVLFAYLATFGDIGYTDLGENFANPSSSKLTSLRLAALGGSGGGSPDPGEPDVVPETDPPPTDDQTPDNETPPVPPGPGPQPDPDPPPAVSVPEPAPMGLFALGLAGLFMFGKRRSLIALARDRHDRA